MLKKINLIVFSLALLSGCLGGYSPDSNFYRLQSSQLSNRSFLVAKSVMIDKVRLPEYLDRPQMVILDEKTPKIEISEFNRWGEDLANMIQRQTVADLSAYLPNSKIINAAESVENTKLSVKIEIIRLDMIRQGKVVLEARWYIIDASGKVIKSGKYQNEEKIKPNFENYASSSSEMLADLNMTIAQAIAEL